MAQLQYYGTGRRKTSVARVRLLPGDGKIVINGKDADNYLGAQALKVRMLSPFEVTDTSGKFDVLVNVKGGGMSGQVDAIKHGIARALLMADDSYRQLLKKEGLLTRDPRMKERKKYGLRKARRAPQFSKR